MNYLDLRKVLSIFVAQSYNMESNMKDIWQLEAIVKEFATFTKQDGKYTAVFLTGDFDALFDYGRGILQVEIYVSTNHSGIIAISTIDDGVWQAYGPPITEDVAQQIIEIFKSFGGFKLPTEAKLNAALQTIHMYGTYTG